MIFGLSFTILVQHFFGVLYQLARTRNVVSGKHWVRGTLSGYVVRPLNILKQR